MKIQIFDKNSGSIIGYIDVGDMNTRLQSFEDQQKKKGEKEVGTHMLMLYVKGIFIKMEYPLAMFPTTGKYVHVHVLQYYSI